MEIGCQILQDSGSLFAASYDVAINNVQEYSRYVSNIT